MLKNVAGFVAGALLLAVATPALAEGDTACPAEKAPLPAELSGWTPRSSLIAAAQPVELSRARLIVGKSIDARLAATPKVKFAAQPGKLGDAASYGGLYAFPVKRAGTYRVALGAGAWLDVVPAGSKAALTSTAHGHGPDCSGIHKMVDFALEPGTYVLQISASTAPEVAVLVARLP